MNETWYKMYIGVHVKWPLFLYDFNGTWIFLQDIFRKKKKTPQISNFMKIRPVGDENFHVDGHDEANSRLSQFWERS